MEQAAGDAALHATILTIADCITAAFRNGGKLLLAGNGGSAADAQHIAGEFLSRLRFDRNPLPAIALTTDTSVLTAVGNDYGYEQVFERQIRYEEYRPMPDERSAVVSPADARVLVGSVSQLQDTLDSYKQGKLPKAQ